MRWIILAVAVVLAACQTQPTPRGGDFRPPYDLNQATRLARTTLAGLQRRSFAENREYCGVIGFDSAGTMRAAPPSPGQAKSCRTLNVPQGWFIIGTYHTHGGYDPRADSEVPSVRDMESVIPGGLVGYLSTPGGRFWRYDGVSGTARLICGAGCLPQDPIYIQDRPVAAAYTFAELQRRQGG